MNVCYEIYETMQISEVTDSHDDLISMLQEHISRIAGYHLLSKSYIYNVQLSSGSDVYSCSDDSSSESWRALINVLDASDGFTLSIGYTYEHSLSFNMDNIGIDKISNYLNDQSDEYLNTVYYKTYSWSTDSHHSGELAAYGMKAGRLHRGLLTYLHLYRIPEGKWFNQHAAFSFQLHDASREQISQLEELCRELMLLSSNDTLEVGGNTFTYSMNNAFFDGIDEVEKYISCVQAIMKIIDMEVFDTYFFDSSANNMKLLHITIHKDKERELEIAEL